MLLSSLISNNLTHHWQIQPINFGGEVSFRIRRKDGTPGVVFLRIDGDGKWDLDGTNRVVLRNF
jgi:hypothetical protein